MDPNESGENKDNIMEETREEITRSTGLKLIDFIPIYISEVGSEAELDADEIPHPKKEKRFLDFLKAHPSTDWFQKLGIVARISPFSFLRRSAPTSHQQPGGALPRPRPRFRVPFVRKIDWGALLQYLKDWIKHPANMAFVVWLLAVGAGLLLLLLVISGLLNQAIPKSSERKQWAEIINQILNALFTIMCVYQHPRLFHHLVLLCRWTSRDAADLRKVYCKYPIGPTHDRAHVAIVVALLHVTCLSQYALCGLYWGYKRTDRPDVGETLCVVVGIAAPVVAGVYTVFGPLGRKRQESIEESERRHPSAVVVDAAALDMKLYFDRGVVVTEPEWAGGLFDCRDDPAVCALSFLCTFCVFGWNMERLGFGNMYVHVVTFVLLCLAPFWVFNVAGLNIDDTAVRAVVGALGIALCFFGLLYGGFWRAQMRRRFGLPPGALCCGRASPADFARWLFCWSCALAQEVRTGNFYEVEEDSFYRKRAGEVKLVLPVRVGGGSERFVKVSVEDSPVRCQSCPGKIGDWELARYGEVGREYGRGGSLRSVEEEELGDCRDRTMSPPAPAVIHEEEENRQS